MRIRIFSPALFCVLTLLLVFPAQSFSKDNWINVRSKNFFLVGNANEKEMRQVATKLEQFREAFRLIFARVKFNTTIQTNVVVFKNNSSYKPFKPKLANGKPDDGIAGYFQPGEDLNYITLSSGGEMIDTYGTIFHEYTHFLVDTNFGRSQIPPWFNEGLAEYYQTFKIENDQKVLLGDIQEGHLQLLQQNQLIPLKTFFEIDNYSLHQNGNHSRSIFYAQAWALMHFLIQGNKGINADALNKFLNLVMNKVEPEKAFQQAFQMDYATMETALKKYVAQSKYTATSISFKNKLIFDTEMTTIPLSEAEANAYLGDLLYHAHRYDDAEIYLQKALALDADSSLANTAFGLVRMRQRKFDEAKKYLEKAVAGDAKNHFAQYNYAYILSRESMDEFGYVSKFPSEAMKKMREALQKAIEINPNFTESYRLLAFIIFVNGENLDESAAVIKKALTLQPGNQDYALLLAQIYLRQEKYAESKEIAENVVKTASEAQMRSTAQGLLNTIKQFAESKTFYNKQQKEAEDKGVRQPLLVKKNTLSESEFAKIKEENSINDLNRLLEPIKSGESRIVGYIQKIACVKGEINYTLKTETETLSLASKDFTELKLISLVADAENLEFGCDTQTQNILTVITYSAATEVKSKTKGNVLSIAFVPKYFRLKTAEELAKAQEIYVIDEENQQTDENSSTSTDRENSRKEMMLRGITDALRKPQKDEKREIGIIEKIQCSGQNMFFHIKTATQTLILKANSPQELRFTSFTPDAAQMQFGCGVKMPDVSAVITYRPNANSKEKHNGDLVSVEFVPKSFKLE